MRYKLAMTQIPHDHSPEAIAARLNETPDSNYLREWVYGGIDGVVTTFAIVAGVTAADLPPTVILIVAMASLLGDGFSMAAGCYSSTRTDEDNYKRLHEYEKQSVETYPEGEKEEIRQIFKTKGFEGQNLENIVETITENKKLWVHTMMVEEYGLTENLHKAWPAAFHTFIAFFLCGLMPVMPFIFNLSGGIVISSACAGITFFTIGAIKSRWSAQPWWWHGSETFLIGAAAAGVAYGTGYGLRLILM